MSWAFWVQIALYAGFMLLGYMIGKQVALMGRDQEILKLRQERDYWFNLSKNRVNPPEPPDL